MPYPCKRQLNEIFNVKNKRKCHDKKKTDGGRPNC